ncbi:MAG: DNA primase [Clostridia bacterium]|nr:DNA primase [Clostridia bacterium]
MAGVDQEFLRTLKEKVNIVDVAGSYITLDKRGASYWACCPFHHEKTPSFAINEAGQYYHCFGCGESGDVIRFVSEMETLDFMDAVKLLADRAKMPMPETGNNDAKTAELKRKRDALLKILNECAHFYLNNLNSGNADAHINYILKRQIPSHIVRTFGLGASLNFTDLPKYLLSRGYSRQDIVDSGTVNDVNGRLTDAQGGRLIFPIINSYGEVIAFGGRALKKTDFGKYVNTRETAIFNKRKNLYNINLLKKLKRTQTVKEVIMVEGYMDTLSLYQAGFKNVVASMGTSLTPDQARLIKRYVDTVLISYDGDGAGQKANLRGLDILKDEGLNVKVVPLPEGLDPDDVIKQRGAEGYQACLDAAMPLIEYKLSVVKRGYDLSKTEDKLKYVSEALGVIRTADSEAEREELLKRLRSESGISFEALKRDLQSAPQSKEVKKEPPPVRKDTADSSKKASRFVLSGFLFGADYTEVYDIADVPFKDDVHTLIAKYIRSKRLMDEPVRISELFEFFDEKTPEFDELTRILDNAEGGGFTGAVAEKYFADCLTKLKLDDIDERIAAETKRLSGVEEIKQRAEIAQTIYALARQREKIKNGENI